MIQKAKRTLAMLMAAVMLCGLLPVSAMATTTEQDPVDATTTPVVTEQPEATEQPAATETPAPSETVLPTEQPEETLPDEDTPTAGLPEEVVEPYALTYEELLVSTAQQDQPFASGTLGSQNFRIPALVTLSDGTGTLVAAADARWNHTQDGQNTDTMVAVSDDNGQSWKVSPVNYFADTKDKQTSGAASFIDPALATDGENVYLLVDVFPGGVDNLNHCQKGTGYNDAGCLMLSNNGGSSYDYYVGKFTDGYAPVMSSAGETEYAVDERYDLYTVRDGKYTAVSYRETGDNGAYIAANVFYRDATFTVYPTSYLWLVKSEDGGKTWSAPQILNDDVKGDSETFYGVGPGRGLVTSDSTIYFSCYQHGGWDREWGSNVEKSSLIYSKDGGETWERTNDLDNAGGGRGSYWSSENQAVQLNNGTIRMFYRNGRGVMCYVDLNDNGSWGSPVSLESTMAFIGNQYICSSCQLSVIHYSETIDGKEAILVSCPSAGSKRSTGKRENGKIFVFTVNADNTLTAEYSYQVNTGAFQYSCLTELDDGSIGILYEDGAASITYKNIAIETIAPDAVIGNGEEESTSVTGTNGAPLDGTTVNLAENGEAQTISVNLSDGQNLRAESRNADVVTASVNNNEVTLNPVGAGSTAVTLTVSSKSRAAGGTATATLNVTVTPASITNMDTVDLTVGKTTDRTISNADLSGDSISYDPDGIASVKVDTESGTTPAGTYAVLGSTTTDITSGNKYVIASGNSVLATSGTNLSSASMPSADTALDSSVLWTIEGNSSSGYTISQKINGTTYYLGYTEKPSGIVLGAQAYTYTLALTKTRTTWSWDSGNHRFFKNLVTQEHWFDPYEYDDYFFTWNSDSSSWQMTTSSSSLTLYTTEEKEIPGESYTNSILTFTGVAAGTTTVTIGNYRYTVNVTTLPEAGNGFTNATSGTQGSNSNVTKLTITTGTSFTVAAKDYDYDASIEWSSQNPDIASVSSTRGNGTITGVAAGTTYVTATIDGVPNTIEVTVLNGGYHSNWTNPRIVNFYISEITDTTVYYSMDCSTTMTPVQEGEVIYLELDPNEKCAFSFFGAPNTGYALTRMSATASQGQYFLLHDGDHKTVNIGTTGYLNGQTYNNKGELISGAGVNQQEVFDSDAVVSMLREAIAKMCDGGMGFTRKNKDDIASNLTFRSERLPTVSKRVVSINNNPYKEGMIAHAGDVIKFEVTVTKYACEDKITYTDARLNDLLDGATFDNGSNQYDIAIFSNTFAQDLKCTVTYKIKDTDLDTTITNNVKLAYTYKAEFSSGSFSTDASASASISAVTFVPDDIVIDFGLPVTIDYSGNDDHGLYDLKSGTALYGKVEVKDNKVTYTPTSALKGVDTVTLYNTKGASYTFYVYPATTVYYDASFVKDSGGNAIAIPGIMQQAATAVDAETFNYGYEAGYSNSVFGKLPKDGATFTFTGTGVDIYANPTSTSCYVAVRIYKDKELVRLYVVDTAMEAGTTTYTTVPTSQSYNVPIVSELGLEYGTYTVNIQRVDPEKANRLKRDDVVLNGFRVYGTLESDKGDAIYTQDNESSPTFTQLRDVLINTLWKTYTEKPADLNQQYDQVYAKPAPSDMTASIGDNLTADYAQDLLINGPKNEIYLTGNQTLTITVPTSGDYQIGLKALDAEKGTVSINSSTPDVTNVDMFYEVTVDSNKKITIKNTSESAMIAVTYLKKTGE